MLDSTKDEEVVESIKTGMKYVENECFKVHLQFLLYFYTFLTVISLQPGYIHNIKFASLEFCGHLFSQSSTESSYLNQL